MELPLMIGLFILLGYFMLVRPARTQAKKQSEMLGSLEPGARVMTRIGVYGTLVEIGEVQCRVEVAPGTTITLDKSMLAGVTPRSREEFWVDPNAPQDVEDGTFDVDGTIVPDSLAGLDGSAPDTDTTTDLRDPEDRDGLVDDRDGLVDEPGDIGEAREVIDPDTPGDRDGDTRPDGKA